MNRTLKRPMFRLGGPTSEGITSGLDRPRMANADMDMKIKQITQAYESYRQQGGTLSFEDFSKLYAEENFNSGGRVGFQTGGFNFGGLPGFAISTGLDLLSRPPSGGLLSTVAQSAKGPFETFQASQLRRGEIEGERAFKQELADIFIIPVEVIFVITLESKIIFLVSCIVKVSVAVHLMCPLAPPSPIAINSMSVPCNLILPFVAVIQIFPLIALIAIVS